MPKILNRVGMRYGRLVVVEYAGRDHRNKVLWLCKCDCGNKKVVVGDNLSSGKSNSCGCLKKEFLEKKGNQWGLFTDRKMAIARVQYNHIKRRHMKMTGELMSFDDFYDKIRQLCYYCGLEFSKTLEDIFAETKSNKKLSDEILQCNGIDRIDSSIGYTKENTVPCCKFCNCAKNTMSVDEFKNWATRLYNNFINK